VCAYYRVARLPLHNTHTHTHTLTLTLTHSHTHTHSHSHSHSHTHTHTLTHTHTQFTHCVACHVHHLWLFSLVHHMCMTCCTSRLTSSKRLDRAAMFCSEYYVKLATATPSPPPMCSSPGKCPQCLQPPPHRQGRLQGTQTAPAVGMSWCGSCGTCARHSKGTDTVMVQHQLLAMPQGICQ
jgi:hypothetical protein